MNMETNAVLSEHSALFKKGEKLVASAAEYWKEYQKHFQRGAVVFLETESGALVLFTRGEYKRELMSVIDNLGADPLASEIFFEKMP